MNVVTLIGRLTQDPKPLRETGGGTSTTTFRLAVSRPRQEGADQGAVFVDVVSYGALAESIAAHLKTGREVGVAGRLDHREWEADDGSKRSKHEVVPRSVDFLRPGRDHGDAPDEGSAGVEGGQEEEPF